ncbi:MAG: hypothetical protein ACTSVY_10520 [Candidatus Helarchaeota archaeon]
MVEIEWTGKRVACIIIFTIIIGLPSLAFYVILPYLLSGMPDLVMILTGVLGVFLGLTVGFILAFGGGKVFLGAFLGGLIAMIIAVIGLMFGDTISGFTGGLLVGLQTLLSTIPIVSLLINFILAPILLSIPIDWILIERGIPPNFYPMLILFGLLPWILGGVIAGLINKGYPKGSMSAGLIGINIIVFILLINGVLVALGSLLNLGTMDIFSGLTEGMYSRNFLIFLLSGFEAVGVAAAFGGLIGALRGPADDD